MGNNPKKVESYNLDDWQFVLASVAGMARWRVRVQSVCPYCGTKLWIPLKTIALTRGKDFSMWGLELPCNRVGCEGWRTFKVFVPEAKKFIDLAPRFKGEGPTPNVGRHIEKPRSLR